LDELADLIRRAYIEHVSGAVGWATDREIQREAWGKVARTVAEQLGVQVNG